MCECVYVCVCVCMCLCMHTYIYAYILSSISNKTLLRSKSPCLCGVWWRLRARGLLFSDLFS